MRCLFRASVLCAATLSGLAIPLIAHAQVSGFSYTPSFTNPSSTGNDSFRFTPLVDISVTSLGYFDDGLNGLTFNHNVGLYNNSTQALLASTVVGSGTNNLDGMFQYEAIAPVTLFAGTEYAIVGHHSGSFGGNDRIGFAGFGNGLTLAPEINYGGYRSNSTAFLSNPQGNPGSFGYFGANFRYDSLSPLPPNPPGVLVNGGFERGDLTGWTTLAAAGNGVGGGGRTGFGEYNSFSGEGPDTDIIAQSIATIPGRTYDVTFYLAGGAFLDPEFNPDNVTDQNFRALWDGTEFFNETGREYHDYEKQSFALTATGTSSTLSFSSWSRFGFWQLDDVSVTAAAPEPPALGFMAVGIGLAGIGIRRCRTITR